MPKVWSILFDVHVLLNLSADDFLRFVMIAIRNLSPA